MHWPVVVPQLSPELEARMTDVALQANDRYLSELVEGQNLCPFAREGRRRGETSRWVRFATGALEELSELMLSIAQQPGVVVAQVIFPGLEVGAREWEDFCFALTREAHAQRGGADVLAVAPLHPHLPFKLSSAFAAIPLFRRAPDPTIQWVRLDQLEKLHRGRPKGSTFIDPADILSLLESPERKPLYDRVAEANWETLQRMGVEQMEQALLAIHTHAQRKYVDLGAPHCGSCEVSRAAEPSRR